MGIWERMLGGHHSGRGSSHGRSHDGWGSRNHHDSRDDGSRYRNPSAAPALSIACAACGTLGTPGARFCQQCGGALTPAACDGCGTARPVGAKFCAQCGKAAA